MTLGDLNIRMVLEIVEANKSAQQFDSNLKSVDSQSKKTSQSVTDLGKTANKTSADIKDVATNTTKAAKEVSLLGETFSHLSTLLKATVILYVMDLIFSKISELTSIIDNYKKFQDEINAVNKSITESSTKIADLTNIQQKFQNYNSLSVEEQKKLNTQLGKAINLYPDIVLGVKAYNGQLTINSDHIQSVIDREQNLIALRRDFAISDQAAQIDNLIDQYQKQITIIDNINEALADNGQYLKDNTIIFNAFGNTVNVVTNVETKIKELGNQLLKTKNETANLQLKMLDAVNDGLKFGDVESVLSKMKLQIGNNTGATRIFFDTISQLVGQGINDWDSLRSALINYKNELAAIQSTTAMLPNAPTPADLQKRISEQQKAADNESDANKRKEIYDNIKEIQKEYDKMTYKTTNTGRSSTTGTSAKDKQAELDYLAQLKKDLEEINLKISKQSQGASDVEGLFIKKRSIESEIELIQAVNTNFAEYLNLRSKVATMPTDLKSGISIIPEDEIMKFKILLEQQKRARQEMERSYDKLVSDLSAASSIVSSLSQSLEEGGKGFFYWINVALQAALQVANLVKESNSEGGLSFGSILGAIGSILPFFLASGGSVPGSGSGDTVPAMLTPGEYVLNKSAVSRLGTNMLNWLNGGGSVVSSMPKTAMSGGSNNIVINLMGELTDQLTHKIYSRGSTIVNVRKEGSSF